MSDAQKPKIEDATEQELPAEALDEVSGGIRRAYYRTNPEEEGGPQYWVGPEHLRPSHLQPKKRPGSSQGT